MRYSYIDPMDAKYYPSGEARMKRFLMQLDFDPKIVRVTAAIKGEGAVAKMKGRARLTG